MIVNVWKRYLLALCCLVLSPIIYFFIWLRTSKKGKNRPLRILVIPHLATIGDLVCATPVFRAIKKQYPGSFVAVVVSKMTAGIIKNNPHIDEIMIYRTNNLWGLISRVRQNKFDWSFSLTGSLFGTLISFAGLTPNRAATIYKGRSFSQFLTDWLNNFKIIYQHHTYLPGHYLKMLKFVGIENAEDKKEVFTAPEADKKAEDFLRLRGISDSDFLVGISISAGNKIKEWGDEKFKELARKIADRYNAKILFRGAKADEERIDKILTGFDPVGFFKDVDFSLEEMPSIIKRLNLYIAADSGPIYVARALDIPLIDIIGPIDPNEQPPNDERSIQVRPPANINPSSFVFKKPGRASEHKKAVDSITVDMVMGAVETLSLKRNYGSRTSIVRQ